MQTDPRRRLAIPAPTTVSTHFVSLIPSQTTHRTSVSVILRGTAHFRRPA